MAGFITAEQLKAYPLPVTDKQWSLIGDDQINLVAGYASQHLEDYMDRKIAVTQYTERHRRGTGTHRMLLGLFPVKSILAVTSTNAMNVSYIHNIADFYVEAEAGILEYLERYRYAFGKEASWTVVYTAGYDDIPGPILHATALQTVKMLQPLFRGGSQFTESELISELDEQIVELLEYYKRRRIG